MALNRHMQNSVVPTQDYVWVAARMEGVAGENEYYGRMEAQVFHGITANELVDGWFRLNSVSWEVADGEFMSQTEAGKRWGFGDVSYFRIESLVRLIILTDDFVARLIAPKPAPRKRKAAAKRKKAASRPAEDARSPDG